MNDFIWKILTRALLESMALISPVGGGLLKLSNKILQIGFSALLGFATGYPALVGVPILLIAISIIWGVQGQLLDLLVTLTGFASITAASFSYFSGNNGAWKVVFYLIYWILIVVGSKEIGIGLFSWGCNAFPWPADPPRWCVEHLTKP